jgi:LacI family gluconate utilization system Gnt-I transcriptional repressor
MRRGWSVPQRLAIAGYGNYEIGAQVPPGLATIDSRGYEIGRSAAALIAEKVETGTCATAHRNIGYELVVRGSV